MWQDIVAMLEPGGEQGHYMGYLVLQSSDERNFDIIDGQQRMTTLSLLVLAVLNNLQRLVDSKNEPQDNDRRIEELRKTYIGYLDPVTLVPQSKLTLNRHNDQFYQTYLVPLERPPKRNLKASEHLLRKGFQWFEDSVRNRLATSGSGADLARFVDVVADRLFFTVISVTDELNAFKVFETLNARGVRLSSTDLLKNYLFSVVHGAGGHEHEMRTLEDRWEAIVGKLGSESVPTLEDRWEAIVGKLGSESVPDFLRVFWNSQHPLTRHSDLFKTIRTSVRDKQAVFALLRDMDRDADIYGALGDPDDPLCNEEQEPYIGQLEMFNVRQPLPLLLSARRLFDDASFTRILRACSIVSLRYNVIGNLATNEQERVYNAVAEKIGKGSLVDAGEVVRALRPVYSTDEQFRAAFSEKQIRTTTSRNRQVIRYVLFEIERHVSGQAMDYSSDKYTVEHILPEHPDDSWSDFSDEQIDRCVYRIGNMTLLEASANREIGNKSYAEKREIFRESCFEMTRRLAAEHAEWTPERIASRQQWLAAQATAIWRLTEM